VYLARSAVIQVKELSIGRPAHAGRSDATVLASSGCANCAGVDSRTSVGRDNLDRASRPGCHRFSVRRNVVEIYDWIRICFLQPAPIGPRAIQKSWPPTLGGREQHLVSGAEEAAAAIHGGQTVRRGTPVEASKPNPAIAVIGDRHEDDTVAVRRNAVVFQE